MEFYPRKPTGRRSLVGALALAVAVVSVSGGSSANKGQTPKILRLGQIVAVGASFNPFVSSGGGFLFWQDPAYDRLIQVDQDEKYVPGLAASWGYRKGAQNKIFTIVLRKGLRFSDRSPLNSAALKANFEYGAKNAGGQQASYQNVTSIETPTPTKVILHLTNPDPSIPYRLTGTWAYVVNPKALANPSSLAAAPQGAGPYKLDTSRTIPNQTYVFVRNPFFYDKKLYPYDEVRQTVYASSSTAYNALRGGQIDATRLEPADAIPARRAGYKLMLAAGPIRGLFLWDRGGTRCPALGKVAVRQALNFAIDRKAAVATAMAGLGKVGAQWMNPGKPGYVPELEKFYPYNPTKARALLREAGYANGFNLTVLHYGIYEADIQILKEQLAKVGVNLEIERTTLSQVIQRVVNATECAFMFNATVADGYADGQAQLSKNGLWNALHYDDPKISYMLNSAAKNPSAAGRTKIYEALNTYVTKQGWFLTYGYSSYIEAYTSKIKPFDVDHIPGMRDWAPAG